MKTTALRLYGKRDLRLEALELPPVGDDELLCRVVCDSLCMSSYKAAMLGPEHKRVPGDVALRPVIIGHEFCGEIVQVGANYSDRYQVGGRFTIQPAMQGTYDAAGYTFPYLGGDTQYAIVPACYLEQNCVLPYEGDAWFHGALAEPLSCVIGAARASYHTVQGGHRHRMGIQKGGNMAILAGAGPMGLALIDYILHCPRRPALLVVTDMDGDRLSRAARLLTVEAARALGVRLVYLNTGTAGDPVGALLAETGGHGFNDVFVFAPVASVVEQGDAILTGDGCLNFFAGPTDDAFSARLNFYNVHYNATHVVGTSGGNTDDMRLALHCAAKGCVNPSILVTHIGGLNAAAEATLNLAQIPGGKKLIYTHVSLPLTAIAEFGAKGKSDPLFQRLDELCNQNGGLWSPEAEQYLLQHAPSI